MATIGEMQCKPQWDDCFSIRLIAVLEHTLTTRSGSKSNENKLFRKDSKQSEPWSNPGVEQTRLELKTGASIDLVWIDCQPGKN